MALLPTLNRVARAQFERQIDAEDAVLEAVAKAWEKRGQLREERYFNTWVVRILINVCRDAQRKEQHEVLHEAPGEGPGEAMEREQADGEPSEGTCEGPGEMAALEREEDERLWLGEGDERLHAALFSLD
jgi:RNA polymerase sigma factor (sigma-70 family)